MTSPFLGKPSSRNQRDYSPICWTEYYDEAHDVILLDDDNPLGDDSHLAHSIDEQTKTTTTSNDKENSFRVYLKNFHHPYAPSRQPGQRLNSNRVELSEAELSNFTKTPTLVALHGGGYSALTWALFTKHIQRHCHCRILAIDLRAHGDTKTTDDDKMDIDTLVSDVISITHATHQQICGFPITPKIILIGHSMGGAIVVKCADKCAKSLPSLAGFVVIDVVEGTAKDALPLMLSVIKTRPTKFPTISNAIEWSVRSGMTKNSDAARVSMPGNLVNLETSLLAIHHLHQHDDDDDNVSPKGSHKIKLSDTIKRHKFDTNPEQLVGSSTTSAPPVIPRLPLIPRIAALKGSSGALMPPPLAPLNLTTSSTESALSEEQEGDQEEEEQQHQKRDNASSSLPPKCTSTKETEEGNTNSGNVEDSKKLVAGLDNSGYCWRTNLAKTQPYWSGWFDGLSAQLLSSPVQGKFLLLAGIDRLDKTLTIGHMQGKFMMKVLPKCGHAVHEDVPEQVASAIGDFLVRNKFTMAL